MTTSTANKQALQFNHPDYAVGCGGTETPTLYRGKHYLYVWNHKEKRHEYYIFESDVFIPDTDAPWYQNQSEGQAYNRDLALRMRNGQVGSGMTIRA